jgi:hypothetical protein
VYNGNKDNEIVADITFIETAKELGIEITEKEAEIIVEEIGIMQAGMNVSGEVFKLKLADLIKNLETRGMTSEQVINVLLDDFETDGAIFGGLKRQLIGSGQGFVGSTAGRLDAEQLQRRSGEEKGTWVCVLVNTCQDCIERHGITRLYVEWEELGMPTSGFSVCKDRCQCQVFPASLVESKEELQAPLKRTKGKITQIAREKKEAGQIKSVPKYVNRKLGRVFNIDEPLRPQFRKHLPGFKR